MGSVPIAIPITFLLVIAVLSLLGIWRGWTARSKRFTEMLPDLPELPIEPGSSLHGPAEVAYVSSTTAGNWLDRVVTHDLGFKSAGTVEVFDSGILIDRVGVESVFIPAQNLIEVAFTKGMAGKFMGRDAIVVLTWLPSLLEPEVALDTGVLPAHSTERDALADTIRALITPSSDDPDTILPSDAATQPATTTTTATATATATTTKTHPEDTQAGSSGPKEHT